METKKAQNFEISKVNLQYNEGRNSSYETVSSLAFPYIVTGFHVVEDKSGVGKQLNNLK